MGLNLITAPTVKPLLISDVEAQTRTDLTSESLLIDLYIGAVTAKAESHIKRALITQTWELTLDHFPCSMFRGIHLPLSPVQEIASITYIDGNGMLQTLADTEYTLTVDDPNVVMPSYGINWPLARMQPGSVTVRYIAGYGDTAADVPESIRAWMLLNVADLYENRETVVTGKSQFVDLRTMADSLLDPYRLVIF